jgi:1,2-diacylglycerol 3-alpha-glucosyltransferase
VLIACPGLEHVPRGFETLARECFDALRAEGTLEVLLAKGSGQRRSGELVARTVRRDATAARLGGRALRRDPYEVEQLGFAVTLLPLLARVHPDVVCVSDWLLSRALAKLRPRRRSTFKLVVSNGGPYPPELLGHADHVQELTPGTLESALGAGEAPERHTLLPLGVAIPPRLELPTDAERRRARAELGIPTDRRVVLSVAALNRYHKRVDYLVREIASLSPLRPYLVLLGGEEEETPAIRSLAASLLGDRDHTIRTVPADEVQRYYRAADVFAVASLWEAFGRVMVEAMSQGLPCVAHDGPVQRYVLGCHGLFGDFRRPGRLARLLGELPATQFGREGALERHRYVYERFSWDVLAPRYAELLRRCATGSSGS